VNVAQASRISALADSSNKRAWHRLEQEYFCEDLMRWYVQKVNHFPHHIAPFSSSNTDVTAQGDEFSDTNVVRFSFYRAVTNLSNLLFTTNLFIYTGDAEAPIFKNEGMSLLPYCFRQVRISAASGRIGRYTLTSRSVGIASGLSVYTVACAPSPNTYLETGCKLHATLQSDLSSISPSAFELVSSTSGDYYKISYELEMSFHTMLSFKLIFQGKSSTFCPLLSAFTI
jgi:hypothetical protein